MELEEKKLIKKKPPKGEWKNIVPNKDCSKAGTGLAQDLRSTRAN